VTLASCTEAGAESWVAAFLEYPALVLNVGAEPVAVAADELHDAFELVGVAPAVVAVESVARDDVLGGAVVAVGELVPASVLVFVLDEPVAVAVVVVAAAAEDVIEPVVVDADEPDVASVGGKAVADSETADVERDVLEEAPSSTCYHSASHGASSLEHIPQVAHPHFDTEKGRMQTHPEMHQSHAFEQVR